jgi:hypothetical protein
MIPLLPVAVAVSLATAPPPPRDVVGEWIDRAAAMGYRTGTAPTMNGRCVALVALAMFDALNVLDPRFTPFLEAPAVARFAASGWDAAIGDAAAAAAAHQILVQAYPDQASAMDSALAATLAGMPEAAQANGVRLGTEVASRLWAARVTDGWDVPNAYRPLTTPGAYVPTASPLGSSWGMVKPFVLRSGNQFRPGPPPALTSREWAADYDEVKRLGAKRGAARTLEQTEIARFWEYVGPGTYMPVARQLVDANGLSAVERARIYALVATTASDALIAVFDAKFTYNFWRPVTAIRNGDVDGNDATERDAGWEPLIATPMHPEYPCAHCITQTAVASVLAAVFGDTVEFALTSPTAPGITRRYRRLSDYAAEVLNARIYDGVHYRGSGNVGAAMGREIAAYAMAAAMTPRRAR